MGRLKPVGTEAPKVPRGEPLTAARHTRAPHGVFALALRMSTRNGVPEITAVGGAESRVLSGPRFCTDAPSGPAESFPS